MLFIQRLCTALHETEVKFAIVGGHAVAFHGAPRGTLDIDFVISWTPENLLSMYAALTKLGLESRQPVEAIDVYQFRHEYVEKRGLISWNFFNPADYSENVDVVINFDLDPNDIMPLDVGEVQVPVLKLDKLIEMKQNSSRDQDRFDLEALLAIQQRREL